MTWFRSTPLAAARWAVVDCETSGLDATRDRLLSVAAVGVAEGRIVAADALEAYVRQEAPSERENILVHGIGAEAQRRGQPLGEVLEDLARFLEARIPVAFRAPFDETFLRRHGLRLRSRWLDLATLAPALFPDDKLRGASLEDWLAAFGIEIQARHQALADAFSAAQLFLVVLAEAARQRMTTVEALFRAQAATRWLGRH